MIKSITVTTWNNGKHNTNGKGYGIRIGKKNRVLFNKDWKNIELSIEGKNYFIVPITKGFWNECPELRSEKIGKWFYEKRIAPWNKRETIELVFTKMNENQFKLNL